MSWPQPYPAYGASMAQPLMAGGAEIHKTQLWMGELEPWMDEAFIKSVWHNYGEDVTVKLIRDKTTGNLAGYCFVDFGNPYAPPKYLQELNGKLIPGTRKQFKLNWASGSSSAGFGGFANDYPIFVGDLGAEVNEYMLLQLFQSRYPSTKHAKIVTDPSTGLPKGYGFVRFGDESESIRAIAEMNGVFLGSRAIRVSTATSKKSGTSLSSTISSLLTSTNLSSSQQKPQQQIVTGDHPENATIFIGGIDQYINEEQLRLYFGPFGDILTIKIPTGHKFGFIQFFTHESAKLAIQNMNGTVLGHCRVKVSWGQTVLPVVLPNVPLQPLSAGYPQTSAYPNTPVIAPQYAVVDPLRSLTAKEANDEYYNEQLTMYVEYGIC